MTQLQNSKLPKVHKKAPVFEGSDPDGLIPWLEECEQIFAETDTTEHGARIVTALKWMDFKTREEWRTNAVIRQPGTTWEEFKNELKKGYPDSAGYEKGSKRRLFSIVEHYRPIPRTEYQKFQRFMREFLAELAKLQPGNGAPQIVSNSEAVQLFLAALDEAFSFTVFENIKLDPNLTPLDQRREDDLYMLSEIIQAAECYAYTLFSFVMNTL